MPTRITLTFFGETQFDRTLEGVQMRTRDARPAWEAITERFLAGERAQFDTEGRSGSGGWSPLSPRYAAWKAAHYPGMPILVRTGTLRKSLTDGPAVRILEPQDMWIGSDVAYGKYHQRGAGRLPQRKPVDIPESVRREFVHILQRHIIEDA